MEFLLYLNSHGQQLIRDLISAKFHVHENIGLCKNPNLFGYTTTPNKFIICTKNIKNSGFNSTDYVSETVYHEAIHAAQICNNNRALGLDKKRMPISYYKQKDIQNSMKFVGDYTVVQKEHEAYYFEDKPEKVRYYVKKFCF